MLMKGDVAEQDSFLDPGEQVGRENVDVHGFLESENLWELDQGVHKVICINDGLFTDPSLLSMVSLWSSLFLISWLVLRAIPINLATSVRVLHKTLHINIIEVCKFQVSTK
uniref:Uncharacterized protein n=1 Tax=Lepeophtheirus salmonis TaxID=72036 RepID=A0A0K2UZU4_LEPSM